jgi:hypothetical protein
MPFEVAAWYPENGLDELMAWMKRGQTEHSLKEDEERDRLEQALEEGLRGTFPASDAVSVVQPAAPVARR